MPEREEKKAMTLRLPGDTARNLELTAQVDGVTISDAVREAIETHIRSRREDDEFRERLRHSVEENNELLKRLAN